MSQTLTTGRDAISEAMAHWAALRAEIWAAVKHPTALADPALFQHCLDGCLDLLDPALERWVRSAQRKAEGNLERIGGAA